MIDIIGNKYGKLVVLSFAYRKGKRYYWNCVCDCGKTKVVIKDSLISGSTKSCGCLSKEASSNNAKARRLSPGESNFNSLYTQYINRARLSKIIFQLTKDQFRFLVTSNCHYCDRPPSQVRKIKDQRKEFIYTGIDRVDTKIGYAVHNCVPCCKYCNVAKHTLSYKDFLKLIKSIYLNLKLEEQC